MKKKIISNTVLFIIILMYILGFKKIFGDENILIAVTSITGLLMFMSRDLTSEPVRNTLGIIGFNLIIGLGAYAALLNPFLGIVINFLVVFMISYAFCYTLKAPMYLPFTLCYLFLLSEPVGIEKLPLRLLALIFGGLSIMLPQFIINKNKVEKSSKGLLGKILELNIKKIDAIINKTEIKSINQELDRLQKSLRVILGEKKERGFYFEEKSNDILQVLSSIEKLSLVMEETDNQEFLKDIKIFLNKVKVKKCREYAIKLKEKWQDSNDYNVIQGLGSIFSMAYSIKNMKERLKNEVKNIKEDILGLKDIKLNSIKLNYALRISICVAIAAFIMQYFKLTEGKWIVFTVLSLTSPIFEVTKSKAKDRVISTILGTAIIVLLFYFIQSMTLRTMIIMAAGYVSTYATNYRQKIILVTVSAVGAAAIMQSTALIGIERILLVVVGVIIALIINTFIFRCDVDRANRELFEVSNNIIKDLINNLELLSSKKDLKNYINNIYVLNGKIDTTIETNLALKEKVDMEGYRKVTDIKSKIILSAHEIQKITKVLEPTEVGRAAIEKVTVAIKNKEAINSEKLLESLTSINDKIVISLFIYIKQEFNIVENYI